MTRLPLTVSPQAEEEAQEAAQWYENESPGLGVAFLEIVEQTLTAISEHPLRFPRVYHDIRRALLKRFPYGVFFRVRPNRIKVTAIMHLSRDPSRWQKRR
jgi:plasmid stabilization system protein ParE